jgi:hypothetical protein
MTADRMLDIVLALGPLVGMVTVQPGDQQPLRPIPALDKRGSRPPLGKAQCRLRPVAKYACVELRGGLS